MAQLTWDQVGERIYETGVDHGVLYIPDSEGVYDSGYAWNGLVTVTESPSGAEATPQYADNIKYLNLVSAEEFGATVEAFTYPPEFAQCDGSAEPVEGVTVGQQTRKSFGMSYRTRIGNDVDGTDHGYKLHLIYGALAAPTEKAFSTINDSPEAITFSWELTTTPVEVPDHKPSASITINSTKVDPSDLADLEQILYGSSGVDPRLPLPAEIFEIFGDGLTVATPIAPTFDAEENEITIPTVTGITYRINNVPVTGVVEISTNTLVKATPNFGYKFPAVSDDDWLFVYVP